VKLAKAPWPRILLWLLLGVAAGLAGQIYLLSHPAQEVARVSPLVGGPYLRIENPDDTAYQSRQRLQEYLAFTRDAWQKPDLVMKLLDVRKGQVVGDIGSGSGYFTFRLADAVGADGKIYAVDADAAAISFLQDEIRRRGTRNIFMVMTFLHDIRLPTESLDRALMCDVHAFGPPQAYRPTLKRFYASLYRAMKPGGRLVVVEGHESLQNVKLSAGLIAQHVTLAGFILDSSHDFLPLQFCLVFHKPIPAPGRKNDRDEGKK